MDKLTIQEKNEVINKCLDNIDFIRAEDCGLCLLAYCLYDTNEISYEQWQFILEILHDDFGDSVCFNLVWESGYITPRREWLEAKKLKYESQL